jgi:mono/diheme cytochrome c family protein
MMNSLSRLTILMALGAASALSHSEPPPAETRGQLLYTTHCISCHTTEMHWRSDKLAYDWDSLKYQVRRWQSNAGLQWGDADIVAVAHYLNDTIYQYPRPAPRVSASK